MTLNKTQENREHITAVRFVYYFSEINPYGTLSLTGENRKGMFCRLIPCKINANGQRYGIYHNRIITEDSRDIFL